MIILIDKMQKFFWSVKYSLKNNDFVLFILEFGQKNFFFDLFPNEIFFLFLEKVSWFRQIRIVSG